MKTQGTSFVQSQTASHHLPLWLQVQTIKYADV